MIHKFSKDELERAVTDVKADLNAIRAKIKQYEELCSSQMSDAHNLHRLEYLHTLVAQRDAKKPPVVVLPQPAVQTRKQRIEA